MAVSLVGLAGEQRMAKRQAVRWAEESSCVRFCWQDEPLAALQYHHSLLPHPVQEDADAIPPQTQHVASWLLVQQSEKRRPCDRCEPVRESGRAGGERASLLVAPQYSALAPDSLQIFPGRHLPF